MNLNLIPQSRTLRERVDKGTPPLTRLAYQKGTSNVVVRIRLALVILHR